jgi:hypothetical protein
MIVSEIFVEAGRLAVDSGRQIDTTQPPNQEDRGPQET